MHKRYMEAGSIPQVEAERLVSDLVGLPLSIVPVAGLLTRSLQIGLTHQLAVYDSTYIALAEKLRYPLITVDLRQEAAARALNVTIKSITDFTQNE
jgi:predicted nucleic acid-binding protein